MDGGCGGMDDGAEGWAEERPEERSNGEDEAAGGSVGRVGLRNNGTRLSGSVTAYIHSRQHARPVIRSSCTQALRVPYIPTTNDDSISSTTDQVVTLGRTGYNNVALHLHSRRHETEDTCAQRTWLKTGVKLVSSLAGPVRLTAVLLSLEPVYGVG